MDKKYIMRYVIKRQAEIKRLLLSQSAVDLIKWMRKRKSTTTLQVAGHLDITIQNASTRLKKLYDIGYLTRKEVTHESGGIEYIYYADVF